LLEFFAVLLILLKCP